MNILYAIYGKIMININKIERSALPNVAGCTQYAYLVPRM